MTARIQFRFLACCVASLAVRAAAQQQAPVTPAPTSAASWVTAMYPGLSSRDDALWQVDATSLLERNEALICVLIDLVDDPRVRSARPAVTVSAMGLLGRLRAAGAVDALTDHLCWQPTRAARLGPPSLEDYPAAGALCEIGAPAVPALISVIATAPDPKSEVSRLGAWLASECLRKMDGPAITVLRLRLSAQSEQEPERRQRLLEEAKRIETIWGQPPAAPH